MVDIIVRAKNNHVLTAKCLTSIRKNTPTKSYRLILSDDGSDPATGDALTDIYIRSRFCHGAVTATNMGLGASLNLFDNKYTLILDNDTSVPDGDRGWLLRMVENLEAGGPMMGCLSVTEDLERPELWYTSHAALFRKSVMAHLGPFDEQFNPGMYAAEDYAVRMRVSGFSIGMAKSVVIHREPEEAFIEGKAALAERNRLKFLAKWDDKLKNELPSSEVACPV